MTGHFNRVDTLAVSNRSQLVELLLLSFSAILDRQLVGQPPLTDHGVVTRAIHFVQIHYAFEVHFLLEGISLRPLEPGELLIVAVPLLKGVLVEFVQFVVGLLVNVDDQVHHSIENLLVHNCVSGIFIDFSTRHFASSLLWLRLALSL